MRAFIGAQPNPKIPCTQSRRVERSPITCDRRRHQFTVSASRVERAVSMPGVAWLLWMAVIVAGVWLLLELAVRAYVAWPLRTDFYGSIARDAVRARQQQYGVRVASGSGWAHLGWIADPERERYRIERQDGSAWRKLGRARVGSYLLRAGGTYRVWAEPRDGTPTRFVGEVAITVTPDVAPLCVPRIVGPWRTLFRPTVAGDYINDHTIYRDAHGEWRLVGITAKGTGDYSAEQRFAVGVSADFPPAAGMAEATPIADFGAMAWAPHVIAAAGTYHVFWSPHRLHRMTSRDGIEWTDQNTWQVPAAAITCGAHAMAPKSAISVASAIPAAGGKSALTPTANRCSAL